MTNSNNICEIEVGKLYRCTNPITYFEEDCVKNNDLMPGTEFDKNIGKYFPREVGKIFRKSDLGKNHVLILLKVEKFEGSRGRNITKFMFPWGTKVLSTPLLTDTSVAVFPIFFKKLN